MSFERNDTVNLGNYEEAFLLYVDDELTAAQKQAVDAFVLLHPHLAEELEALLSTKLMVDDVTFAGKEELLSPAMKLNVVDEDLLLYIDEELNAEKSEVVKKKIAADKDYALQHALLLKTKLDAREVISYPDKNELYRREERTVHLGYWLRAAAAVIVLLTGSLVYWQSNRQRIETVGDGLAANGQTSKEPKQPSVEKTDGKLDLGNKTVTQGRNETAAVQASQNKRSDKPVAKAMKSVLPHTINTATDANNSIANNTVESRREAVAQIAVDRKMPEPKVSIDVNKNLASVAVTPPPSPSYNNQNSASNNPEVDGWAVETKKKTPARGFLRKVSRFIEHKTGIGTVNDDNELLIGAVALKLK